MIFGRASLVRGPYCQLDVGLCALEQGSRGRCINRTLKEHRFNLLRVQFWTPVRKKRVSKKVRKWTRLNQKWCLNQKWYLSRLFWLGPLLLFFVLVCEVFCLFFVCLVTTYWTVHKSFTSSLLTPLNQQSAIFAPINHVT